MEKKHICKKDRSYKRDSFVSRVTISMGLWFLLNYSGQIFQIYKIYENEALNSYKNTSTHVLTLFFVEYSADK